MMCSILKSRVSRGWLRIAFALLVAALACAPAPNVVAQNCPLPPALQPPSPGIDMFNDEQEADLGDAMAEQIAPHLKIIENSTLTDYLRGLGSRLVQYLPPNKLNFRFYLIELPEPNAFSIAGGRVYVSRKLIILANSEDELAGVIAHELGHIVTHQSAIYMTQRFRDVLSVRQVSDRADVFARFHQYVENSRRKPAKGESEEKEQTAADQVGLYTAFRAGYSPQAYVDILDRTQETHGQTGSWLSDLFGATKPAQRRLRDVMRNMGTLPPGCADKPPSANSDAFARWKQQILNYSDTGGEEVLPGLLSRSVLTPALRPDISHLRFSPDGKYLIAQDEGGIHVLTRTPLAVLFYIPAPDAHFAEFTPDSQSLVFYSRSWRVETWNISTRTRTSVHEVLVREPCIQSALSFDGKVLACLNPQFDLVLLDVPTSTPILTKKQFFQPTFSEVFFLLLREIVKEQWEDFDYIQMKFSPEGHYFAAGHSYAHTAFDLNARREISLPGSIRDHLGSGFAFLGDDRIVVINAASPAKSPILRFPSGERLDQLPLGNGVHLRPVAHGDYLLVGPLKEHPLGIMDLKTKHIGISFKRAAADLYDDMLANERLDGEVALYPFGEKQPSAAVTLPQARLGRLRAAAVSSDLQWIAVSNRTRGGLWNLSQNHRALYFRGIQGPGFRRVTSSMEIFPSSLRPRARLQALLQTTLRCARVTPWRTMSSPFSKAVSC